MSKVIPIGGQRYQTDLYNVGNDKDFEAAVVFLIKTVGVQEALERVEDFVASQSHYLPTADFVATIFGRASRKEILVTGREMADVVDDSIGALAERRAVYQRGNRMVDFVRAAEPDTTKGSFDLTGLPKIRSIPWQRLREQLNEAAVFRFGDGTRAPAPPKWIVETILARGEWANIPPLSGVAPFPLLRPDGTILNKEGYDRATGLYYICNLAVDVPASPTLEDARRALAEILDVVVDFPFKDEASKAAYVAALLTPLARFAIDGPVPMFCFNANTIGAGKGLVVDTIGYIVLGRDVPKGEMSSNEEELSKRLATLALKGAAIACFDNVKSVVGGAMMEGLATANTVEGRKLGSLEDFELPWRTSLFLTGNNLSFTSDMARRVIMPTLESPLERPAEREGLRDLIPYCLANRERLLGAALTILRAFHTAGRPKVKMRAMGSFERWSAVVRAPIIWLGMADPLDTQEELRDAGDPEREAHEFLLETWFDTFGEAKRTAKEILAAEAMAEAVAGFVEFKGYDDAKTRGVKLGAKFRTVKNKIVAGLKLVSHQKSKDGIPWSVVRAVPTSGQR